MMKAVCIDDEKLALEYMTHLLKKVDNVEVVESFQQAEKGLEFILQESIDVVFLDIQMPEIDGLELAEKILEKKPFIHIVFVTAYNEYAVTAFELNAIDYLMKPVKLERLEKTIERLKLEQSFHERLESKKGDFLNIQVGNNVSFALANEKLSPIKWRTTKARELFLYLLQNKETLVHKGTLMEVLWSEDELDRGYSILYTTVYNVRKALQDFADYVTIKNTNDGYLLKLNKVRVDLHEWERGLQKLPDEVTEKTIDDYLKVMALNSGPYLDDYDYIWVESEKQRLEKQWVNTMKKIIDYYIERDQYDEALQQLIKLVDRAPELEDAHLMLMELYALKNQAKLVEQQYEKYINIQGYYGLRPSPKIRKWYTDYLETI